MIRTSRRLRNGLGCDLADKRVGGRRGMLGIPEEITFAMLNDELIAEPVTFVNP